MDFTLNPEDANRLAITITLAQQTVTHWNPWETGNNYIWFEVTYVDTTVRFPRHRSLSIPVFSGVDWLKLNTLRKENLSRSGWVENYSAILFLC
ncbi:hypothetical protein Lepto7375DRAFT_5699 [Leptolyngbya sp. PCC 7375]|nr:hypothetical protein Lepto7375DRAFT_5699 [Leptolyngbya sp. PCC 7375]